MTIFKTLLSLLCVMLLVGCEHDDPVGPGPGMPDPDPMPTLSSIQENIFDTSCALSGCHAGANPQQGMNLSAGEAFGNIVGVPSQERPGLLRVVPGNPDDSYLVHKIEGRSDIVGQRMPLGGSPLSSDQINLIRTWIANGAENN